ncbi:MAG: O-antigen ligase family protein [Sphingobacterium sp.]|jgi:hypothetical protein|nr:O-antigen ligase family protein [Sphingobacterium sp.]
MKITKNNFETSFLIAFIIIAFLDEVLTIRVGPIFFTPLKAYSLLSLFVYLKDSILKIRKSSYQNKVRSGFTLLYIYILISIIFSVLQGGAVGGLIERFFHFFSSLIIIDLFVKYIINKKVDLEKVINVLLSIYFIELTVTFLEAVLQRPLINLGVVNLSPLKIRGFHGDRIYLAEYLPLGWFLFYIKHGISYKSVLLGGITFFVIILSGSNTAILLFLLVAIYITYSLKNTVTKIFIIFISLLASLSLNYLRSKFLDDTDQMVIQKRNEMYYESDVDAKSNWRLFAISTIWEDFVSSPTIFGHGYEGSEKFLERKSGYLYKMKPHNIISVLYDYGFIGGIFAIILLWGLVKNTIKTLRINNRTTLSHLSFIFSILILARLLFYYHTTVVWVYILGIAIIVAADRVDVTKKKLLF